MSDSIENKVLFSSDSHVMEPPDLWSRAVDGAPEFPAHKVGVGFQSHPGGWDPNARLTEMVADGVSAEVLYPTLGLRLFGLDDAKLQEACFRCYNDWIIEYSSVSPNRLVGIGAIPTYNIDVAIAELERCQKGGLKGGLVWQVPHPDFPFTSNHYDRFWAAAEALEMPISIHILTGHGYDKQRDLAMSVHEGLEAYRGSVNLKLGDIQNAIFDLIFTGILERHPKLKIVIVENEIGWIPWILQQWDYYAKRFGEVNPLPITMPPSHYFHRQIFATFFNDAVGARGLEAWGIDNCMWSNDFPHGNSTWPNSRQVIARDLGLLPEDSLTQIVVGNVTKLYNMEVPAAVG